MTKDRLVNDRTVFSGMQDAETKIINRGVMRTQKGLVACPEDPYVVCTLQHSRKSYQDEWHEEVCWEEAKTRAGGKN